MEVSNNKQTQEANEAIGSVVTLGFEAFADGKLGVEDLIAAVPKISVIQQGVIGIGEYPAEAAKATVEDKVLRRKALGNALKTGDAVLDYDLVDGLSGVQSLIEAGIRIGVARGAQNAIRKIEAGEAPIRARSEGAMSDAEALAWVLS